MENTKKINWFIGHMKKTMDILNDKKKSIDFVLEILDSRAPNLTSNDDLMNIFNNKKIIKICSKSDLIDKKFMSKNFIYCNSKNHKDRAKVLLKIENELKEKKEKMAKKGVVNPIFVGMVVGLPNIGKSSFINFLANKKILNVENRPGVTRKIENIKITNNIFLIDTPGVFVKKVENYNDGLKLSLLNCVNRDLVDIRDVANELFDAIILNNKLNEVANHFNVEPKKTFDEMMSTIFEKRFKDLESKINIDNLYFKFIQEIFDSGKINIFLG